MLHKEKLKTGKQNGKQHGDAAIQKKKKRLSLLHKKDTHRSHDIADKTASLNTKYINAV